jgi:hypothetical protein
MPSSASCVVGGGLRKVGTRKGDFAAEICQSRRDLLVDELYAAWDLGGVRDKEDSHFGVMRLFLEYKKGGHGLQ